MLMSFIWLGMMAASLLYAAATGRAEAVSAALLQGAEAAVELCLAIAGPICLWSGLMEVMHRSGMAGALARLLRPLLRRVFPKSFADEDCAAAISQNFTANLLGLGNAATPAGLKAAARMHALSPEKNLASGEMCRLVVLNSASVQLIPTTVAALRSAAGAADAFDILPCVWLTSIVSVAVGLVSARVMEAWSK